MKQRTMVLNLVVALATVGVLSSCNQDPYQDKPDSIKNGIPPELNVEPPVGKPLPSDALRIDSLDFYTFKEGVKTEITISGRVLDSKASFDLSIDNAKDFPNHRFDSATGKFEWEPPRATTGAEYAVPKRLVVRLTSKSPVGGATIGTTKSILLYVTRAELDPEVVYVDDLSNLPTREGELRKFNVVVKDLDATDVDGMRPRLVTVPSKRGPNDIAGLVYLQEPTGTDPNPMQDPADRTRWIFKMQMDLRSQADQKGRDFTRLEDKFFFGLQVVTRYGRVGMKDVEAKIRTDVLKPQVSWFDPIDVVAGQENMIQFTVFDPNGEGKLDVNFTTRVDIVLPGSATVKCVEASRDGTNLCRLSWKPTPTTSGNFDVEFEVRNSSRVVGDPKFIKEVFRRRLNVIKVVPPVPAPVPAPPVAGPVPAPRAVESNAAANR